MPEGVNRHIVTASKSLDLPADVVRYLASFLRQEIETVDIIPPLLIELSQDGL